MSALPLQQSGLSLTPLECSHHLNIKARFDSGYWKIRARGLLMYALIPCASFLSYLQFSKIELTEKGSIVYPIILVNCELAVALISICLPSIFDLAKRFPCNYVLGLILGLSERPIQKETVSSWHSSDQIDAHRANCYDVENNIYGCRFSPNELPFQGLSNPTSQGAPVPGVDREKFHFNALERAIPVNAVRVQEVADTRPPNTR